MSKRHLYYYNMNTITENLYRKGKENLNHHKLIKLVCKDENIKMSIKLMSENTGRNTPGLDNLTYNDIKEKPYDIIKSEVLRRILCTDGGICRRVYIPKANGKLRGLGIANIYDRIAQQCFLNILEPIVESKLNENSLGFRKNKDGLQEAMKRLVRYNKSNTWKYVVDIDLEKYFDTIDIDVALNVLRNSFGIKDTLFLKRLKHILKNRWIENNKLFESQTGVPQGSILGPLIGNVVLHDLDNKLDIIRKTGSKENKMACKSCRTQLKKHQNYYNWRHQKDIIYFQWIRFADDIRLICGTKSEANELLQTIKEYCKNYKIKLTKEKTTITRTKSIEFVGLGVKVTSDGLTRYCTRNKEIWKKTHKAFLEFRKTNNGIKLMSVILGNLLFMRGTTNAAWYIEKCHYQMHLCHKGMNRGNLSCFCKYHKIDNVRLYEISAGHGRTQMINLWSLWDKYKIPSITRYDSGNYESLFTNDFNWSNCLEFLENERSTPYLIYIPGLLHQQKGRCAKTKVTLTPYNFVVHHKIPYAKGGTDDFKNLCLVTKTWHNEYHKSNKSL